MPPNKSSKPPSSLIDEFCNVTGATQGLASSMLEACGNNLEMAINMHMEGVSDGAAGGAAAALPYEPDEPEVRAPIPQKQEILVEGPEMAYSFRGRKRIARSVFDKFRDFEAEAKQQEEALLAGATAEEAVEAAASGSSNSNSSSSSGSSGMPKRKRKMKTLEDLFRPPIDLLYRGTFQAVRDGAVSGKKWLMVNIQDSSEFACQILNRDVWSNPAIKTIVREHFLFWQVYHDSEEGQRYMQFYKVKDWPYVAIIDPRTGECLVAWDKIDALTFCDLATEFLTCHPSIDENTPSPPKKKPRLDSKSNILEADEEAQLEAAIKASLEQGSEKQDLSKRLQEEESQDSEDDNLDTFDSDSNDVDYSLPVKNNGDTTEGRKLVDTTESRKLCDTTEGRKLNCEKKVQAQIEKQTKETNDESDSAENSANNNDDWKSYLGKDCDPVSKLMLRLPDGSRDIVSMPCTSKLMALIKYVSSKGFSNESFELVTNFPRRQISYMDFEISLKDAGLFPQESIFIQAR